MTFLSRIADALVGKPSADSLNSGLNSLVEKKKLYEVKVKKRTMEFNLRKRELLRTLQKMLKNKVISAQAYEVLQHEVDTLLQIGIADLEALKSRRKSGNREQIINSEIVRLADIALEINVHKTDLAMTEKQISSLKRRMQELNYLQPAESNA